MVKQKITTLEEFITAVRLLTIYFGNSNLWWRGQADSKWPLSPGIIRSKNQSFEGDLINRFLMKAKSRYSNCPQSNDIGPWLFLMQHYRLPTRLLDWTESPLVALYFAVQNEEHDNKDAAIWGLQPIKLNFAQSKMSKVYSYGSPEIRSLFQQAQNFYKGEPDLRILAVQTEETDIRHLAQQSQFTIHGSPTPMEDLPNNEKFLGKIVIRSSAKRKMRRLLEIFAITRSYLFPDLENLSAELASLNLVR